jgi:hypothetical protein
MEQFLEWNSPLNINFIDYEMAFDSETLWELLRQYGVPQKIISLIRSINQEMSCRIIHASQLSDNIQVKIGLFTVAIFLPTSD